jgi:hypothetical protein
MYVKNRSEEKDYGKIKQAYDVLQSKNLNIETINECIRLNEKLKEHGLSIFL